MLLKSRIKNFQIDWLFLFIISFSVRLIGINFGLPFEHHPDEEYIFGQVDNTIDSGWFYPGIYNHGYIFYYLTHITSLAARIFIDASYIREYEILLTRIAITVVTSLTVIIIYEISRRIYQSRLISLLTALIFSIATANVILSRFIYPDHLISLFLGLTILTAIKLINKSSTKLLILMFIIAGVTISPKFSYFPLIIYCLAIYLLIKGITPYREKIVTSFKYSLISVSLFFLGNIFEIFHLYSWLGRNYYFLRAYNTPDFFYFKSVHTNYLEHLWTMLNFLLADFYIVSNSSGLIVFIVLALLAIQSFRLYKSDKKLLIGLMLFPIMFILISSKAQVFQMRTVLPIAAYFLILAAYPFKKGRFRTIQILTMLGIIIFLGYNTIKNELNVSSNKAERKVMDLFSQSRGKIALPNVFGYPSIEYAYYDSEIDLNLSSHNFFRHNQNKIIYYQEVSSSKDVLPDVDYFIIQQMMMQGLRYKIANERKEEPFFESIDISNQALTEKTLNDNGFVLVDIYQSSEFETIAKYDPAYLGSKKFLIYEKTKK